MLESFTVLNESVGQSVGSPVRFPLRLRRAWQRDISRLGLQYIDTDGRVVPGQWFADREETLKTFDRLDKATRRVAMARAGNELIVLQPDGADLKLPALARLIESPGAELLAHRPGRRAVVRIHDGTHALYAKALRPSKFERVLRANRYVASLEDKAFGTAAMCVADERNGLVMMHELCGRNLHDLAESDHRAFVAGCGRAGVALRSLHVPAPAWLTRHDHTAEAEMLQERVEGIRVFVPTWHEAVRPACDRVCSTLNDAGGHAVVLHRDFYDKQIILDPVGEPSLLDFDTLGAGEAALDLANMLAHIELRVLQGHCDHQTATAASRAFLDAYGPPGASLGRIPAYLDAARLRLAMLYAYRPRWSRLTPALLDAIGRRAFTDEQRETPPAVRVSADKPGTTKAATGMPVCPLMFVVGCPRSGTTMLERMLDAHRDMAMTHETHWVTKHAKRGRDLTRDGHVHAGTLDALYADHRFVRMAPPRDEIERLMDGRPLKYRRFVRVVFEHYRQKCGKAFVGDKSTGGYLRDISRLMKVCPDSKIVHLVRDGRDVCLSILNWPKSARAAGRFPMFHDDPVATTAAWWRWHVQAGMGQGRLLGPGVYRELRYEALVREPERECAELCMFLGLEPDAAMAAFHAGRARPGEGKSANAAWLAPTPGLRDWRTQMHDEQIEMFEAIAGDTLAMLGYERRFDTISPRVEEAAAERVARWTSEVRGDARVKDRREVMIASGHPLSEREIL